MQISTDGAGIPQKAIDGSTSAFYTPETCSLTKPERIPWWYVNLLEPYMVQLVRLDFGKASGKLKITLFSSSSSHVIHSIYKQMQEIKIIKLQQR